MHQLRGKKILIKKVLEADSYNHICESISDSIRIIEKKTLADIESIRKKEYGEFEYDSEYRISIMQE